MMDSGHQFGHRVWCLVHVEPKLVLEPTKSEDSLKIVDEEEKGDKQVMLVIKILRRLVRISKLNTIVVYLFMSLLEHVHTLVHCVHSCKNLVVYLQRRWQL